MRGLGVIVAVLLFGLNGAAVAPGSEGLISFDPSRETTRERLQKLLDDFVADHPLVPGSSAYVDAPRLGFPFNGAAGKFAHSGTRPLDPDDPYRNASITKMWTAATVLRLVEEGRISLSDTIDRYLPAELVDRVHVMDDGVSRGRQITMRMMLNHTSGIYNYSTDDRWVAEVAAQPRKEWTAEELVEWAIDNGSPPFQPGDGWDYNDTGYALLTIILKRLTGKPHPAVYREMLPMHKLPQTYVEKLEQPPAGAREKAHQYFIAADMHLWDPSFDTWGGGGLVTTGQDQVRFIRALFEGRVYERGSTLRAMLRTVQGSLTLPGASEPVTAEYGFGIGRIVHDGTECWHHTGAWGGYLYYCPSLDLAFAGTTNQYQDEIENSRYLARRIVEIVKGAPAERLKLRVLSVTRRRIRFRTTAGPFRVGGVRITLAGSSTVTNEDGRAKLTRSRRLRPRRYRARACKTGFRCVTRRVRVR